MTEPENKFVVSVGNPFDGLTLYGPFDSSEEANEWVGDEARKEEWVVVPVEGIEE